MRTSSIEPPINLRILSAAPLLIPPGVTIPAYEKYGQDHRDRAFAFACEVVFYCDDLLERGRAGRVLAPQLLRCGTSIGANLEEARGGESRADSISKCSIALKEHANQFFDSASPNGVTWDRLRKPRDW